MSQGRNTTNILAMLSLLLGLVIVLAACVPAAPSAPESAEQAADTSAQEEAAAEEEMAEEDGICHTHAPYTSSFALLGQDLPAATTPIAHLLGANVPCTEYVRPGYVETGQAIVDTIGQGFAVLVKKHGPFTVGPTPTHSVKIAVFLEEAAKTIHLASLRGQVEEFPADELERSFHFYEANYGQKK